MTTRTILTAAGLATLMSMAAWGEQYRDPQQRFELEVPAGWTAEPFGEGVKVAKGGSYCLVMDGTGEAPEVLVNRLTSQFGGQWSKFMQLKQGSVMVSGQTAPYSFHAGVNPKGVSSFLKVLVASSQGRTFALIGSAPEKEFAAVKAGFDQIEQSFRIAAARPKVRAQAAPVAAPKAAAAAAPAPAVEAGSGSSAPLVVAGPMKAGDFLKRGLLHGGKESASQVKAVGKLFKRR